MSTIGCGWQRAQRDRGEGVDGAMDSGRRYGLTSRVIADIHKFVIFAGKAVWCLDVPLALSAQTWYLQT